MRDLMVFADIEGVLGEELDLADKLALSEEYDSEKFQFITDESISQKIDFFSVRKKEFRFLQDGKFLNFEDLDPNKNFIAFEKERSGFDDFRELEKHYLYVCKAVM